MMLNSNLQPGEGPPPILGGPCAGTPPVVPQREPIRQVIAVLLSLCLGLFVADAVISLADDSLALFARLQVLTGMRGILGGFTVFFSFLVYGLMALSPAIPKRWFVPVVWFNPAALLVGLPAWIYFYTHALQIAWLISLVQVVFALFVLWRINGSLKPLWPLVPERLVQGQLFRWSNLWGFCAINVALVLPAVAVYLVGCGALAVDHFSEGFVALRRSGFTVQVRKYVRADGKSILLVPMAHIGEPEFYRSLTRSFPTNAMILMEGVRDDKNLLTNRITYKRMASTLGLAQQQREFKPSPVQVIPADIDVDQFAPSTIDFLNLVMLIHTRGLTAENLVLLMQSSESPQFEKQVFDDILKKRNQHLLQEIHDSLPLADSLVIPWGAAHMPEIAREIQKSGFRLDSSREFVAIRFHRNAKPRLD
jgi:hypothetical protein